VDERGRVVRREVEPRVEQDVPRRHELLLDERAGAGGHRLGRHDHDVARDPERIAHVRGDHLRDAVERRVGGDPQLAPGGPAGGVGELPRPRRIAAARLEA
jgi:hypothetical protein